MKILFFTPYLPGPPIFGGQRRIHGLMTALAKHHEVSLLSLVDASADLTEGLRDAGEYCRQVVTVPDHRHRASGKLKRVLQLRSLLSRYSWERKSYRRPAVQRALDHHLARNDYDIINCEFAFMGGYRFEPRREKARRTRLVLDAHNVEYDILRRTALATRFDRKLFNTLNYVKLRREERATWARFDGCAFTSERDEGIARHEVPMARTTVIPNGVDIDLFQPRSGCRGEHQTVLFFGAINYYPNTDAVLFLLREVLPHLQRQQPSVTIRIVGPGAPPEIRMLASARVQVVGFVDDLPDEIAKASVVVAPLRIGGGTRLKIVEAMAMAKPIVSTTVGAEGLAVNHERDILLADEPQALAREISRLLEDEAMRSRLGEAARETAEARYSWHTSAKKLSAFYESLLG
jgi:glycosyltransferase involved in cell wall biosynthesis